MVIKINKPLKSMKIGLTGTRAQCFANVLEKYDVPYKNITLPEIDDSFDFIFESGLYEIIPQEKLSMPRFGIIGIHESPLPEGRGHAPIQWAVLNGRKNLTVTLYKLDAGIDSGKIIHQVNMPILKVDTLPVLDKKRLQGIEEVFEVFVKELIEGYIVLRSQTGEGSYHKRRGLDSCELNKEEKLSDLWDKIRICDNDLYPAWFKIEKKKIILRYEVVEGE